MGHGFGTDEHASLCAGRAAASARSRDDKVIAGVCGGLARYLGVDAVILRIAFVVLAFAGEAGSRSTSSDGS